jgi:hypothetical protein
VLLNPDTDDDAALARSHVGKDRWISNLVPVEVVGSGLPIQFWYFNMKRLGRGLRPDPDKSIPVMVLSGIMDAVSSGVKDLVGKFVGFWKGAKVRKID